MKEVRLTILLALIVTSFHISAQRLIWDYTTGAGVHSSAAVDGKTLFIGGNDSILYAFNKKNGKLKWKFKTGGAIKSNPVLYDNLVIFNSGDGKIYGVNTKNGSELWTFETEGEKTLDLWDYYFSSPVLKDNKVIVGSSDGHVYAIDPKTGGLHWKYQTEGVIHAAPLVDSTRVYVGNFEGFFHALDLQTGEPIWKFKTVGDTYFPKGGIQKGAAAYQNMVIFGSRDYNIYALNAETGRGMWNMKEKGSWIIATPLVHDDVIYFGTSDSHRFYALEAKTGYEKQSFPLNMRVYGSAVLYDGNIVFGCFNGKLYRIRPENAEPEAIFQTHGSKANYHMVYGADDAFKPGFELYGPDATASEEKIMSLGAILSTPAIDEGVAFFGDANGVIYAVDLRDD